MLMKKKHDDDDDKGEDKVENCEIRCLDENDGDDYRGNADDHVFGFVTILTIQQCLGNLDHTCGRSYSSREFRGIPHKYCDG